jgi:phage terminase large subunit GpA-like protein
MLDGAELWIVGTDVAKDWIFNRIELPAGAGALHFHKGLDDVWYEQLLSERKIRKMRGGQVVEVWEKPQHVKNEVLDLSVYNLAIAFNLGLHKWSALDWQRLRDKLIPKGRSDDLFAAPLSNLPTPVPSSVPLLENEAKTDTSRQDTSLRSYKNDSTNNDENKPITVAKNTATIQVPAAVPPPALSPVLPSAPATPARGTVRRTYSRGINA